ncbi:hypothetical protein LEP1GSC072_3755 [Leptospira noguchii str. Bonito]|nr:hypothetical protein LEP1GSC072_3755 [Leptospira noguchii str. Bonito]
MNFLLLLFTYEFPHSNFLKKRNNSSYKFKDLYDKTLKMRELLQI